MKFVVDKTIPFIEHLFEPYAEVVYLEGKDISFENVRDADALVIRTRTKCNAALLEGSSVRMISTASIGSDHIDHDYCNEHGIHFSTASGCNATGVMNYVFAALYGIAARKSIDLAGKTLGIVGVGNTGSRVAAMARHIGLRVLLCDPPRALAEGPDAFCSLPELLSEADVVTLHVPLSDTTRRMADDAFFSAMKPGSLFINTSRGEVVDEPALIRAIPDRGAVIIDTWNNEPYVNQDLVQMVDIATPHIAGYSYQGKQNGTALAVRAIARFFGIEALYEFFPETPLAELEAIKLNLKGMSQGQIASILSYNYPIFSDDFMFRMNPAGFENLRLNYSYRREFYVE
ncbi:MAG: 4-phosphoerythronate dehydrogenase [Bacteroidales bacterium]|nr:4-phosphoerythronate dehydrogenase [Bacteroidales bacterium]